MMFERAMAFRDKQPRFVSHVVVSDITNMHNTSLSLRKHVETFSGALLVSAPVYMHFQG